MHQWKGKEEHGENWLTWKVKIPWGKLLVSSTSLQKVKQIGRPGQGTTKKLKPKILKCPLTINTIILQQK
jgi:hypothetical protein